MESNDAHRRAAGAAGAAARLRSDVAVRREASSVLAEATRAREEALADADALVQEAQDIAERLVVEARERADGIVSQARAEANRVQAGLDGERERARREAREEALVEVAELRSRAERLVTDIESSLGGLATVLVDAGAMVEGIGRAAGELASAADGLAALDGAAPAPVTASVTATAAVVDPVPTTDGAPTDDASDAEPGSGRESGSDDDGPADLPSYDCAIDELPDRGFGSADDELAHELGMAVSARVLPPASFPGTAAAGVAGVAAPVRLMPPVTGGVVDDDDLDAAMAARPLGWLFRGN